LLAFLGAQLSKSKAEGAQVAGGWISLNLPLFVREEGVSKVHLPRRRDT
jgi:hypothetical protein